MTRQDVDIATAKPKENSEAPKKENPSMVFLGIYGESSWKSVRIRDIRRGSPAEKAGLLPEDVISQIDETPIESFAELLKYLSQRKGGEQITVGVNRFGVSLNVPVTLEAR